MTQKGLSTQKEVDIAASKVLQSTRHIRVKLSEENYNQLKNQSERSGVSMSSIAALFIDKGLRTSRRASKRGLTIKTDLLL